MPATDRPRDAEEMRRLVTDGYAALEAVLARVHASVWETAAGEAWSPKEQLGHVTFWESVVLWRADLSRALAGPAELPFGDTDAVNAAVRSWLAPQSPAEVRRRAAEVHAEIVALLAGLVDSQLDDVPANPIGDERPWWRVTAGETWTHYPEHVAMLQAAFPDP
jgi:hypothetical protein